MKRKSEYMNPLDRFIIAMLAFGLTLAALIVLHQRDAVGMQAVSYTPFEIQTAYQHQVQ